MTVKHHRSVWDKNTFFCLLLFFSVELQTFAPIKGEQNENDISNVFKLFKTDMFRYSTVQKFWPLTPHFFIFCFQNVELSCTTVDWGIVNQASWRTFFSKFWSPIFSPVPVQFQTNAFLTFNIKQQSNLFHLPVRNRCRWWRMFSFLFNLHHLV